MVAWRNSMSSFWWGRFRHLHFVGMDGVNIVLTVLQQKLVTGRQLWCRRRRRRDVTKDARSANWGWNAARRFVAKYSGHRVALRWPPHYDVWLGHRAQYGGRDLRVRLNRFPRHVVGARQLFIGVIGSRDGSQPNASRGLWLLVTSSRRVIVYSPRRDSLSVAGAHCWSLTAYGLRVISDFQESAYYGEEGERACSPFSGLIIGAFRPFYDNAENGESAIGVHQYLGAVGSPWMWEDVSVGVQLILSDVPDTLHVQEWLPSWVWRRLHELELQFWGLCRVSRVCRMLFLDAQGCVYTPCSPHFIVKLAESIRGFLRVHITPCLLSRRYCFSPVALGRISVGEWVLLHTCEEGGVSGLGEPDFILPDHVHFIRARARRERLRCEVGFRGDG